MKHKCVVDTCCANPAFDTLGEGTPDVQQFGKIIEGLFCIRLIGDCTSPPVVPACRCHHAAQQQREPLEVWSWTKCPLGAFGPG